jgi:6-phosphofructokinase 1
MHTGASAPGMNTAVRMLTRTGITRGYRIYGIMDGFEGLLRGEIVELNWKSVNGWASDGGAYLGTNRYLPRKEHFQKVKEQLDRKEIGAIILIGGFESYT